MNEIGLDIQMTEKNIELNLALMDFYLSKVEALRKENVILKEEIKNLRGNP